MRWLSLFLAFVAAAPVWANPQAAVAAALADARTLGPAAQDAGYLDCSTFSAEFRPKAMQGLAFVINSLSRNPEIVKPVLLPGNVLRVSLSELGWKRAVWDKQANLDPYFTVRLVKVEPWKGGVWNDGRHYAAGSFKVQGEFPAAAPWLPKAEVAELITLTGSPIPVVRADWWAANAFRQQGINGKENGFGYYDWLGVKDRAGFQRLVRLDEKTSLELLLEMRAVVAAGESGVAQHNRQIVRLKSYVGAYWETLDTRSSQDELKGGKLVKAQNAKRHVGRGELQHDAEEHYAALANGLFGFLLCDAAGKLQALAPEFIGADDSPLRAGKDHNIHVGLACVRCHVDGLRGIDDHMRKTFTGPAEFETYDAKKHNENKRQYFSNLNAQLAKDRAVYEEALLLCNGLTPAENAKAVADLWNWYALRKRTIADLAIEFGVPEKQLRETIVKYADKRLTPDPLKRLPYELFGLLRNPEDGLAVDYIEERFATLMQIAWSK